MILPPSHERPKWPCGADGVRLIQAALHDSLTCADVRSRLPELAQTQDLGLVLPAEMDILARHLLHCRACAAQLAELQTLSRRAEAELIVPTTTPEANLSFLQPMPSAVAALWEQIDATTRRFTAEIRIAISRTATQFGALSGGLLPQPVPVPILRDTSAGISAQRLSLPPAPGNLLVELSVGPGAQPLQVAVRLTHADSGQAVTGTAITLLNADRLPLRRANTDAAGRAVFSSIAQGSYTLQARTVDGMWELALVLAEEEATGQR